MGSISPSSSRRVVMITGATSGIGRDLAEHLHARGYCVAITGRRIQEGSTIAASLDPTGETALYVPCHVEDYDSQVKAFSTVWQKWSRLDAVIANAAISDSSSRFNLHRLNVAVEDVPPKPDLSCTDVNFKGVVYATELAVHYMRHNPGGGGGKIVVTGSIVGIHPNVMVPEYSAIKAASLQWARAMAPMLVKESITINTVLPNGYDTGGPFFKEGFLEEHLTTKECLFSAFDLFLDDERNERIGQALETAYKSHYFHDEPEFKSKVAFERTSRIYEPVFELMHGERSGLENTIQEPLRQAQ